MQARHVLPSASVRDTGGIRKAFTQGKKEFPEHLIRAELFDYQCELLSEARRFVNYKFLERLLAARPRFKPEVAAAELVSRALFTEKGGISVTKNNEGNPASQEARRLPPGQHPGFSNLKSKPGVYRCRLRPEVNKRDPNHADYKGILPLTGSKALVLIWVHTDGSLGLRLEKIVERLRP